MSKWRTVRSWDLWEAPSLTHDIWPLRQPWHRPPVCRRNGCNRVRASDVIGLCAACLIVYRERLVKIRRRREYQDD